MPGGQTTSRGAVEGGLQSARADASPGTRLRRLLVGTKLCVGAQAGLGPRMAGRGSGRGLGGTLGRKPVAGVAVTLGPWRSGSVCVPAQLGVSTTLQDYVSPQSCHLVPPARPGCNTRCLPRALSRRGGRFPPSPPLDEDSHGCEVLGRQEWDRCLQNGGRASRGSTGAQYGAPSGRLGRNLAAPLGLGPICQLGSVPQLIA